MSQANKTKGGWVTIHLPESQEETFPALMSQNRVGLITSHLSYLFGRF